MKIGGISLKKFSVFLCSSLLCLTMLSGCGSNGNSAKSNDTKSSQQQVTISYYDHNQMAANYAEYEKNMIDSFEKAHPNIKVNIDKMASPDQVEQQQMAAGGGPDIVLMDGPTNAQEYASAGWLEPIDKYKTQISWQDQIFPWALNTMYHKGQLAGLPVEYESLVVYYNKDMFKKYGWSIPTNYNQLVSLCKQIQSKGIMPFSFGNSDFKTADEWWLSEAFNQTLGAPAFKQVLEGNVPWNSPKMAEAVTKLVNMWQAGYINDKKSFGITGDTATNLFVQQKAAMKMEGTWLIPTLQQDKPNFEWGAFKMPAWSDGVQANLPLAIGEAVGINKSSKHPQEAAELINWMYSSENDVKQLEQFGTFSPLSSVKIPSGTKVDPHITDQLDLLTKAIQNNETGYAAWTYWPADVETYLWSNLDSVYMGNLSIKTYLDQAQQNAIKDKQEGKLFNFSK
jgi:raffinose/stachyose/melibiose transport system substrate-binding protein